MVEEVNAGYLENIVGYNTKRASLRLVSSLIEHLLADVELSTDDFAVLSLVHLNPGITSRQLCQTLTILPPNLVLMLQGYVKAGWLRREPHPSDKRAMGLYLSETGAVLIEKLRLQVPKTELLVSGVLSAAERKTLNALLQKLYKAAKA